MRPDTNPDSKKDARSDRMPGRSFQDSARPLGDGLIEGAARTTAPTQENFSTRATQAARQAAANPRGVAERAKVIGVLRKAEEFMSTANPAPTNWREVRRALELGAGRLGLSYAEYRALTDSDPELVELERRVIEDARQRAGTTGSVSSVELPPAEPEEPEVASSPFARIFVPVNFSMACHRSVAVALDLRRTHGSEVCLFHAMESTGGDEFLGGIGSPAPGGDWVNEGEARLRRFLANIAPDAGPGIEVRSVVGFTMRTLGLEAHRWGATMVVAHAHFKAALFGSSAERMVRALGLPILLLPI